MLGLLCLPPASAHQFGTHCEQGPDHEYLLSIQELQSPTGPHHSDAIQNMGGDSNLGTGLGYVWFDNNLVKPQFGASMGDQSGHCIQVSYAEDGGKLACYFNFNVNDEAGCSGCITAEALFDLSAFPNANLVITRGTGDFHGIHGSGCTAAIENPPEGVMTFISNFNYDFTGGTKPVDCTCHVLVNPEASAVRVCKKQVDS
jgi:hypothetical protein